MRRTCPKTRGGPVQLWQRSARKSPALRQTGLAGRHRIGNWWVKARAFLHLQWRGLDSAKAHFSDLFFGLIFNFVLSPTQLLSRAPDYGTVRPYSDDDFAAMTHQLMALRPTTGRSDWRIARGVREVECFRICA